jgi:hypothetical protein
MQMPHNPPGRLASAQHNLSEKFDREEADLWKQIDPKTCIHPENLPRTHRLAIAWVMYHMLHVAKDLLNQTLPEFTRAMGLFIGVGVRTGINLTIRAGMRAFASEDDHVLPHAVHLWFANMPPDIASQANGVIQLLRNEARTLQSTKNVQERLTNLVSGFDALFHKLDIEENKTKAARHDPPPYQMPPAVYALWHAVVEHQQSRLHGNNQWEKTSSFPVQHVRFPERQGDAYAQRISYQRRNSEPMRSMHRDWYNRGRAGRQEQRLS